MKMKQKELVHYSEKIMMARTSWRTVKNSEKKGVHKRLCSPFKLLMHSLIQLRIYRCLLCDRNWISTCGKECYQYVTERISLNIELPGSTWAHDYLMFTYSSFFCIYKWPMGGSGQWNMNIKSPTCRICLEVMGSPDLSLSLLAEMQMQRLRLKAMTFKVCTEVSRW